MGSEIRLLGRWTGARVVFADQSAGAQSWTPPTDHAAITPAPSGKIWLGEQEELDLTPARVPEETTESGMPLPAD
jgi:hypothetical protein